MKRQIIISAVLTALLSGCASIPDVTIKYPRTTWAVSSAVVVTLGCNAKADDLRFMHAATVTPVYTRDYSADMLELKVKDLGKWTADTDIAATFLDDGRLKGINQATTGQGEPIVRSFASLVGALALARVGGGLAIMGNVESSQTPPPPPIQTICADIERFGDKKPITVTYRGTISPSKDKPLGEKVTMKPSADSTNLVDKLRLNQFLPEFSFVVDADTKVPAVAQSVDASNEKGDVVWLDLQQTQRAIVTVSATDRSQPLENRTKTATLVSTRVNLPTQTLYKLPIPKAALFGRQTFSLGLGDAGNVTSIGYGSTSGTAGALNAATSLAGIAGPSAEIAALKAEGDLIAAQQRVIACQTKPETCK